MSIVAKKIMMGSGAVALPSDDQFNRVSFLSHFEGSNNGVNNAFDDSSSSNHTITANGNVTQGSFGPFARPDGEWSVSFDGSGDILKTPSLTIGTGTITYECWLNFSTVAGNATIVSFNDDNSSRVSVYNSDGDLKIYSSANGGRTVKSNAFTTPNSWIKLLLVRASNTATVYLDGTSVGTGTMPENLTGVLAIGAYAGSEVFNGIISNVRLSDNARQSGNYTVETAPLTSDSNTDLLTCQSNRFVDNSSNGHTITPSGNPAVSAFGPFLSNAVYDPAVNGASAYFDGSGDYLSFPDSADWDFGTGDFTVEGWVNPASDLASDTQFIGFGDGDNGGNFGFEATGKPYFYHGGYYARTSTALNLGSWSHIAFVRSSGTLSCYINGTSAASSSYTGNVGGSLDPRVGAYSGGQYFKGYMQDVRILKGTAVYTSNFTPPTAPLTAITNTKLLLNMADGQAIDSAAQRNLTLYGTAKTSTAQKKFGTASLLLDGNSDYVSFADADAGSMFNFGATKWTIEGWFYQENDAGSADNSHSIISRWDNQNSDKGFILRITDSSGQKLQWLHTTDGSTNVIYTDSRTISNDTWYHFALVKNDNLTLYLNGTGAVLNSSTFTIVSTTIPTLIGSLHESGSPSQYFDGYIDDLRVSHTARYTANFSPPTEPFPDKGK